MRGPLDDTSPDSDCAPVRGTRVMTKQGSLRPPCQRPQSHRSRVPHPSLHPIPGMLKSWLALDVSQLGGPWMCTASPSPLLPVPSPPRVAGLTTTPLPVSLHKLACQPLQRLQTDPASPALPNPSEHSSIPPSCSEAEIGVPHIVCSPHGCPQSKEGTHLTAAGCQQGSPHASCRKRLLGSSHCYERIPLLWLLGQKTGKGTPVRDTSCRGGAEEPPAKQDPNLEDKVPPHIGEQRGSRMAWSTAAGRGDATPLQAVPKGCCEDILQSKPRL